MMVERDVIVVGAGAAGIGVAVALKHAGIEDFEVLERDEIGSSFRRWPAEMRLITPSFPTNSIGMLDLNSIAIGSSPGYSLGLEHPSGPQFAAYLQSVVDYFELPITPQSAVVSLSHNPNGFTLETNTNTIKCRQLIWATGEFGMPKQAVFPGSSHCLHNSQVTSWAKIANKEHIVIGGYESGVDAAYHLAKLGCNVTLVDRGNPWDDESSDPSISLSPYSLERLRQPEIRSRITFVAHEEVVEVSKSRRNYQVECVSGTGFQCVNQPILATGFRPNLELVRSFFEYREDQYPLLNEQDESTLIPGLYLVGPAVRHETHIFCFIYKYRQRFAVVAKAVATCLGLPAEELETYRKWGMYLDDLSCCGEECVC